MMGLCEELHININELLSGERLSEDSYDRKAEENMMNLMEENRKQREHNRWSGIGTFIGLLAVFIMIGYTMLISAGFHNVYLSVLVDIPSLLVDIIILVLILEPVGLLPDFLRGFQIAFKGRTGLTDEQTGRALVAYKYAVRILLLAGPVSTIVQFIVMLHQLTDPSSLGPTIAVAAITMLYALAIAIILSFVELKIRLEMCD